MTNLVEELEQGMYAAGDDMVSPDAGMQVYHMAAKLWASAPISEDIEVARKWGQLLDEMEKFLEKRGDHPYIVTNPKSIQVRDERGHLVNNLTTFWNNRDMVLNGGLDILPKPGDTDPLFLYVCLKHLDHQEFTYIIELENQDEKDRSVFVRLYMAPTYNPDRERFNLTEQYPLFFAMDAFPIMLSPGANTIHRKSADSTVTNPWFTLTSELPPTASLEILEKRVHAGTPTTFSFPRAPMTIWASTTSSPW
ncbi:phenoloxidase 2-like [Folsomia candida]|uniref:phenoloxidase 2-like n=1 Tax=Folsomia candida TaxID=158441 RepID=UPI0016055EA5|nr:phenoloxidase 2-like [Folsomia candida]